MRILSLLYQYGLRCFLRLTFKLLYGYRVSGRANVPRSGPFILAVNHLSYLDPIVAAIGQNRPLRFFTWGALFRIRPFALLIRSVGAFPVNVDAWDIAAYREALAHLKRGEGLMIFPEGRRSETGDLLPLKPGVAHLALRAGAPIIPTRIEGTYEAWSRHRRWPRAFVRLRVRYGAPIQPPLPDVRGQDPAKRHATVDQLMAQIEAELRQPIE